MNNPICFYHSADFDGVCSGAIARHFRPSIELVGYDYGKPFPWEKVEGRVVYMIDVGLPPEDMQRICDEAERFTWIDHHKSAIEAVMDAGVDPILTNCRIEDPGGRKVSACELAWEWFGTGEGCVPVEQMDPMPLAVHLFGRYDVWDHSDERTLPFQYGARQAIKNGVDDDLWEKLLDEHEGPCYVGPIISDGKTILAYQENENAKVAATCCFETELDGFKILACNQGLTNSKLFDSVWDPEKYHMMSPFYLNKRGQWKVSLYSDRDDVDCSEIAKRYGGGGHKGAAGFMLDRPPYEVPVS